jgi:hypothetical protein
MRFWPTVGTRSVLWGTHQFLFHPLTVWLAWVKIYRRLPNCWENLAILLHDTPGYWGCKSMDGDSDGKMHPARSARVAKRVARFLGARECEALHVEELILGHSRSYCQNECRGISDLCAPDKLSILFDPTFFYWLRATLSGEIFEYRRNEEQKQGRPIESTWAWLREYRNSVRVKFSKTTI